MSILARVEECHLYVSADSGATWTPYAGGAGGGGGSDVQYTEDAPAAANPIGMALNLIRLDTLVGQTSTDGDNVAARGTDKGEQYVKHVDAIPVTDNGGSLTVDGTFFQATQPVSATNLDVALSTRLKAADTLAAVTSITNVVHIDDNAGSITVDGVFFQAAQPVTDNAGSLTVDAPVGTPVFVRLSDGSSAIATLPVSLAANQSVNVAQINGVTPLMGAGATGTGAQRTTESGTGTGTQSSIAGTITANTTILAANAARMGASVYNDSTAVLTLLVGAGTQSATVFTLKMAANSHYEVPFRYTGIITGSWASATGSARVMEYS